MPKKLRFRITYFMVLDKDDLKTKPWYFTYFQGLEMNRGAEQKEVWKILPPTCRYNPSKAREGYVVLKRVFEEDFDTDYYEKQGGWDSYRAIEDAVISDSLSYSFLPIKKVWIKEFAQLLEVDMGITIQVEQLSEDSWWYAY